MNCIERDSKSRGETRPVLTDFSDCKAGFACYVSDDHEGSPLRVA